MSGNDQLITEILVNVVVWLFVTTGIVGIAIGVSLNVSSARTLRFLKSMNRWISTRKSLKPVEISRDIDNVVLRRRHVSGTIFTIGGAYTVFMVLFVVEFPYVVVALSPYAKPVILEILVDSLKWSLLLGGLLACVVGIMLLVSAQTLQALLTQLNRSYSPRKFAKAASEMHMTLDNLAEAHPRITGLVLAVLSASTLVAAIVVRASS